MLDAQHRPIGINVVSIFSLTTPVVHGGEAFKPRSCWPVIYAQGLRDCAYARPRLSEPARGLPIVGEPGSRVRCDARVTSTLAVF